MAKTTSAKSHGKLSKKELKQDKLVQFAYKLEQFYFHNQKWVLSVALGVVVIAVAAALLSRSANRSRLEDGYQLTMARMQMSSGRLDEARDLLNRLASSAGHSVAGEAKFLMGRIAYDRQNYSQAAEEFSAYLKDFSVDDELDCAAMCGLAACHQAMGKLEDAAKTYSEVASKYPKSTCAPLGLWEAFRVYRDLKQMDKAEAALRKIRDSYGESSFAIQARRELDALALSAR